MRVLVVSGASGGHIFPALAFLARLKEKYALDLCLVIPKTNIISQRDVFDYKVNYIVISSLKLSFDFKNALAIFKFIKGAGESLFILLNFKPDIVIGFGSLVCVPMIIFSRLLGIKTLIHEQNVIPGRANRLLANFADKIALSFSQTRVYFKAHQNKIVLTGNPLRKELIHIDKDTALDFFGFKQDRFTILVMGGSQGSHRINAAFLKAISTLSNRHNLQIIHLTGIKDYDWLRQAYKDLDVEARLFSFLKEMHYAYSATDLAISRAGATTIAEMIFFGLPAIFIPYPYAYKHQTSNAQLLENKGVALIIEDKALDDNRLKEMIEDLINHPDKLKAMRLVCESMPKLNARDLLVEEVISLIE